MRAQREHNLTGFELTGICTVNGAITGGLIAQATVVFPEQLRDSAAWQAQAGVPIHPMGRDIPTLHQTEQLGIGMGIGAASAVTLAAAARLILDRRHHRKVQRAQEAI